MHIYIYTRTHTHIHIYICIEREGYVHTWVCDAYISICHIELVDKHGQ